MEISKVNSWNLQKSLPAKQHGHHAQVMTTPAPGTVTLGLPRGAKSRGEEGGVIIGAEEREASLATVDKRLAAFCFAARCSFRRVSG